MDNGSGEDLQISRLYTNRTLRRETPEDAGQESLARELMTRPG